MNFIKKIVDEFKNKRIIGIDLAGSSKRETGICFLHGYNAEINSLKSDAEIISSIIDFKPDLIAIDAPLSLPEGRCCTWEKCSCSVHGIMRESDRELIRMGIRAYPTLIESMIPLTRRGINLSVLLRSMNFDVIETYPHGIKIMLGLPREMEKILEIFSNSGFNFIYKKLSKHGIDSFLSAIAGYFYLSGNFIEIGNKNEGTTILPKIRGKI